MRLAPSYNHSNSHFLLTLSDSERRGDQVEDLKFGMYFKWVMCKLLDLLSEVKKNPKRSWSLNSLKAYFYSSSEVIMQDTCLGFNRHTMTSVFAFLVFFWGGQAGHT